MIKVPLLASAEQEASYVHIDAAALPFDSKKIIALLHKEQVSIEYWLEIAVSHKTHSFICC